MKDIFVFSEFAHDPNKKGCLKYNIKTIKWTHIVNWNSYRRNAACTIFEGKIVVSGGGDYNYGRTVEAYDYYEDS